MVSILAITYQSSLLLGRLKCLGVTDISLILNSYRLNSDIASVFGTILDRSSDPSSTNL